LLFFGILPSNAAVTAAVPSSSFSPSLSDQLLSRPAAKDYDDAILSQRMHRHHRTPAALYS
ncbi:hypothetical protein BHM03_00051788, partial [Ensete ventricosum]